MAHDAVAFLMALGHLVIAFADAFWSGLIQFANAVEAAIRGLVETVGLLIVIIVVVAVERAGGRNSQSSSSNPSASRVSATDGDSFREGEAARTSRASAYAHGLPFGSPIDVEDSNVTARFGHRLVGHVEADDHGDDTIYRDGLLGHKEEVATIRRDFFGNATEVRDRDGRTVGRVERRLLGPNVILDDEGREIGTIDE